MADRRVDERPIRRAGPNDAAAVAALAARAYAVYIDRFGAAPEPLGADYARLIRDAVVFVLAGAQNNLAASLVLLLEQAHLLIWSIAVDPALQGSGLGRRLMAFAEAEAERRGLTEVRLYTNERMVENIDFYARLAYRETHRSASARIPGTNLVHMSKRLGGG